MDRSPLPGSANGTRAASAVLGRYTLHDVIASGGMASVHLARLRGSVGFSRVVAIKRIHPHIAREPDFVAMFLDEARLASRVRHPNVVSVLDVAATSDEVFLVMEYIVGESLSVLHGKQLALGTRMPLTLAVHVMCDVLHGLHAAHEANDERGDPLGIVHRDVSPQNILVGTDGVARIVDFGVAKAAGRLYTTRSGELKGKLGYMAPEQVRGETLTRRADVYSAGVTLWELLTGRRMIEGDSEAELVLKSIAGDTPSPHELTPEVPEALSQAVMRALASEPRERYPTALAFSEALEAVTEPVAARKVGEWVSRIAQSELQARAAQVTRVETGPLATSESKELLPSRATPSTVQPASTRRRAPAFAALALAVLAVAMWAWLRAASQSHEHVASVPTTSLRSPEPVTSVVTVETARSLVNAPTAPIDSASVEPRTVKTAPSRSVRKLPSRSEPSPEHVPDDLLGRF